MHQEQICPIWEKQIKSQFEIQSEIQISFWKLKFSTLAQIYNVYLL